jgi:hypothetical protein
MNSVPEINLRNSIVRRGKRGGMRATSPASGEFYSDCTFAFKIEPTGGEFSKKNKNSVHSEHRQKTRLTVHMTNEREAQKRWQKGQAYSLRVKRERRLDLPTPLSPIRTTYDN